MGDDQVTPPPGFKLVQTPAASESNDVQPPPGFKLVQAPEEPGLVSQAVSGAGHFLGNVAKNFNPVEIVKGIGHAVAHPIDTAQAAYGDMQATAHQARQDMEQKRPLSGAVHFVESGIPLIGPALARAGDKIAAGDMMGGGGDAYGLGLATALPSALKGAKAKIPIPATAADSASDWLYRRALKVPPSTPIEDVAKASSVGRAAGIEPTMSGLDKLRAAVDDLNQSNTDLIGANPNKPVPVEGAFQNLARLRKGLSTQAAPSGDLAAVDSVAKDFGSVVQDQSGTLPSNTLGGSVAQSVKQGTYRALGNRAYGEVRSAMTESEKAVARGLKDALADAYPDLAINNAKEGDLLHLEPFIEKRVVAAANRPALPLGPMVANAGARLMTGSKTIGIGTGIAKAVLEDPAINARLAISISRSQGIPLPTASLRVQATANAIGNALKRPTGADGGDGTAPTPSGPANP